jgi:hypothetical protein
VCVRLLFTKFGYRLWLYANRNGSALKAANHTKLTPTHQLSVPRYVTAQDSNQRHLIYFLYALSDSLSFPDPQLVSVNLLKSTHAPIICPLMLIFPPPLFVFSMGFQHRNKTVYERRKLEVGGCWCCSLETVRRWSLIRLLFKKKTDHILIASDNHWS